MRALGGRTTTKFKSPRSARRASPVGRFLNLAEATWDAPGSRNTFQPVAAETFSRNWVRSIEEMSASTRSWLACQARESAAAASPGNTNSARQTTRQQRQSETRGLIDEYVFVTRWVT